MRSGFVGQAGTYESSLEREKDPPGTVRTALLHDPSLALQDRAFFPGPGAEEDFRDATGKERSPAEGKWVAGLAGGWSVLI